MFSIVYILFNSSEYSGLPEFDKPRDVSTLGGSLPNFIPRHTNFPLKVPGRLCYNEAKRKST
jgi:hypothetical protein